MDIHYFVRKGTEVSGPMTAHALKELAASGRLSPQDHISQDAGSWVIAGSVRGLGFGGDAARPFDVFISYSKHNKLEADVICGKLEASGIRCWIAPRDITPGTEWTESIIEGIEQSHVMVLVFSEHANNSSQVRREVERAISKDLPVIPFRVQNIMPARSLEYCLGNTHWLDAFDPPLEGHVQRLELVVHRLLASGRHSAKNVERIEFPRADVVEPQVAPAVAAERVPPAPVHPSPNVPLGRIAPSPVAAQATIDEPSRREPAGQSPPPRSSRGGGKVILVVALVLAGLVMFYWYLAAQQAKAVEDFMQARIEYGKVKEQWFATSLTPTYNHALSRSLAQEAIAAADSGTNPTTQPTAASRYRESKATLEQAIAVAAEVERIGRQKDSEAIGELDQARKAFEELKSRWDATRVTEAYDHVKSKALALEAIALVQQSNLPKTTSAAAEVYRKAAIKMEEAIAKTAMEEGEGLQGVMDAGNRARAAKNYDEALSHYRKAADVGNHDAMFWIGNFYEKGLGVTQDYSQAMAWYRKSADAGDDFAMNQVGHLFYEGKGVERDYAQAMNWFRKAADAGNVTAMSNTAHLYSKGQGAAQDYGQAMTWFRKAADAGNASAMDNIGDLYRLGKGVVQDYAQAMAWYRKSADAGYAVAMTDVGSMYHNGHGVAQDHAQAMAWYRKGAEAGDENAMDIIGDLYRAGKGVTQDYTEAMVWYRKGAAAGNAVAMTDVGIMYHNGHGVAKDDVQAMTWFRKSADAGYAGALSWIGYFYETAAGVRQDYTQAMAWYRKAADAGNAGGMRNLGAMYAKGRGVAKDQTEAAKWYRKAADAGDDSAKEWLKKQGL
jgi:TPR repeat protein